VRFHYLISFLEKVKAKKRKMKKNFLTMFYIREKLWIAEDISIFGAENFFF
jgi:hypothetical protein